MAPRRYSMDKRNAAVEETRRRIVEATLALHSEKGVFDTSWQDIADRADVSVATVYKHFPSLDELVPACGALIMRITDPPSLDNMPRLFAEVQSVGERVERLVAEMFAFYERAAPYLEVGPRERQLVAVQQWEAAMRATLEGLVREALRPVEPDARAVRTVAAMLDFGTWMSFRRHDVRGTETERVINEMLRGWVGETGG